MSYGRRPCTHRTVFCSALCCSRERLACRIRSSIVEAHGDCEFVRLILRYVATCTS